MIMFNKTCKRILCAFTACIFLLSQTAYASKSVSELKEELSASKKEAEAIKSKINSKQSEKDTATARRNELDIEISSIESNIDDVQDVIDEKQSEINSANAKIEAINDDIAHTTAQLKARMKVMYEYGSTSYLEIIMEAKGFSDLFTRIAAVQAIVKHDNSVIDRYAAQIEELEEAKQTVENEKQEQIEAKEILTGKKNELKTLQSEKDKLISELNSDIAALEAAEKQKEKDTQALQSEINKALEAAKKASSSSKVTYSGNGKFGWPSASSNRITSYFGPRSAPNARATTYHRGIDIGAPTGSDVLAAEAGEVLTAGYNGSYGYYITINHGGGYVTLYAHNSRLLVKKGDTVKRGQAIAKCGSTGNSTGPHIHFEIQVNGKVVNPLGYL